MSIRIIFRINNELDNYLIELQKIRGYTSRSDAVRKTIAEHKMYIGHHEKG